MKLKTAIFTTLMVVAGISAAEQRLLPWVGKYPSTKISGQTVKSLLTHDSVIRKMLPRAEMKFITSLGVENQTDLEGEYVLIELCKAHDCPSYHTLIVENAKGDLWIGIYESRDGFISTRWYTLPLPLKKGEARPLDHWYGMDDHTALPESIQKRFLSGHVPQ